ncbi:MAG: hypothetical protein EXR51_09085 [Dehalococcoidia bacterium]|nr:hypothetical protein [Dehalococcoidia bacterium]
MFDTDRFIQDCLIANREASAALAVRELVAAAVRDVAGIERLLGVPSEAGIQTIHRSDELTILNVIWAPLMAIHPHNHQTWAVIGIYGGQEDNTFYRRRAEGQGLVQINGRSLAEQDAMVLGADAIHAVANPRRQYTGAIHVYGGDFFAIPRSEWTDESAAESPYSMERTRSVFAEANERAKELLAARG